VGVGGGVGGGVGVGGGAGGVWGCVGKAWALYAHVQGGF